MNRCPRNLCNRAGEDIGTCVDAKSIMGCQPSVPVEPSKDLVVKCRACDKTRAYTVDAIMHGRVGRECQGPTDVCQAVILTPPKK